MSDRSKTRYPGVYTREVANRGKPGTKTVFIISYYIEGKRIEETVGMAGRYGMTAKKANDIKTDIENGKRLPKRQRLAQARERLQAESTRYTYDKIWEEYRAGNPQLKGMVTDANRYEKHIRPLLGKKEPKDLDQITVARLKHSLRNLKPGTVKNVLELLRRLGNFAAKKQLCPPAAFRIELPRVNNTRTEDLSADELARLLKAIDEEPNRQVANLMLVALNTGMRRGELFRLQWADLDFERGFILIREPKGGTDQKIPMSEPVRMLLSDHPRTGSPYVFPGRGGRQRTCIKLQVNRIKERAGLPRDFRALHGLRHTYASMMASTGKVDMYTLQKLLTHKSPAMTQRYAHLRDDALRQASEVAGKLIADAMNDAREPNNLNATVSGTKKNPKG